MPAPKPSNANIRRLEGPALRAFFAICSAWKLSGEQQRYLLGNISEPAFAAMRHSSGGSLTPDILERVSYVLGIYKVLQILLPDAERANAWITAPNAAAIFAGRSALDLMLAGRLEDLRLVREYLERVEDGTL